MGIEPVCEEITGTSTKNRCRFEIASYRPVAWKLVGVEALSYQEGAAMPRCTDDQTPRGDRRHLGGVGEGKGRVSPKNPARFFISWLSQEGSPFGDAGSSYELAARECTLSQGRPEDNRGDSGSRVLLRCWKDSQPINRAARSWNGPLCLPRCCLSLKYS